MDASPLRAVSDGPGPTIRRIIVDCSHISPDPTPTGIPRVVQQYVTHGRAVAAASGVEILAVEMAPDGVFHVRKEEPSQAVPVRQDIPKRAKIFLEALRYVSRVLKEAAGLLAALVPAKPVKRQMQRVAAWCVDLVPNARKRFEQQRELGEAVVPGAGDVLFCPGYWHEMDMEVYAQARAAGAEVVFLVHDILPVTLPTFYEYPWRWDFAKRLARSFDIVSHYYCISAYTLAEVSTFAAWHRKRIEGSIAYNGFDPAPVRVGAKPAHLEGLAAELAATQPWLMVGTLEPKKGHRDAVGTFEMLWDAGYERPLVVIGRRGWMSDEPVDVIRESRWYGRKLFWLDGIDDAGLAAFYDRSHALLFGSVAEGFGLPLLEAASHQMAVLARDTAVAREILGEAGFYFTDRIDLAAGIEALELPCRREAERARSAGLSWYRWATVVERVTLDILRGAGRRAQGAGLLAGAGLERVGPERPAAAAGAERGATVETVRAAASRI